MLSVLRRKKYLNASKDRCFSKEIRLKKKSRDMNSQPTGYVESVCGHESSVKETNQKFVLIIQECARGNEEIDEKKMAEKLQSQTLK